MPIVSGDIKYYLSGGAANSDPNASLGGAISSTEITSAALHNLFDVVSGAESTAGDIEYRCFYVKNTHGSLTWIAPVVWVVSNTTSGDTTVDIALAGEGVGGTAETVVNESTAPVGEVFSAPASKGTGLVMSDIPSGSYAAIWVRWTVNAGAAAFSDDNVVIRVEGDTVA